MKPTQYEIDKLARMTRENEAELAAIKVAHAAGTLDQRRVRKLNRAVKAQVKLERELNRRASLNGPDIVCAVCGSPCGILKPTCDKCDSKLQHIIGGG